MIIKVDKFLICQMNKCLLIFSIKKYNEQGHSKCALRLRFSQYYNYSMDGMNCCGTEQVAG